MTFLVPFDGSELALAALVRATEFGTVLDERVLAVTVVPDGNERYARERDWLDPGEAFDRSAVVSALHESVAEHCPSADFRHELVGRYARPGQVGRRIREVAEEVDASMVFVGSENAGGVVTSLSSVGSYVATDDGYDVVIVRHRAPSRIPAVDERSPYRPPKSDFYPTE